jgi:SpoVK/Ycf46/Vps4 family AAA+-type ATPase
MHNLRNTLDERISNNLPIHNTKKRGRKHISKILDTIDKNYITLNSDPFIKKADLSISIPRTLVIKKEKIIINKEISSLQDLIDILINYPIVSNAEYNIDINRLQKIQDPLIELNTLIGMHELKTDILDQILFYIQDLHLKKGVDYMHTVLNGPPGTGKTEVARIIGIIFSNLGILEKKTFRKVVRSDLIAGYLGQTAIKTTKVIEEALGGVLFIDEAYALGNSEKKDSFAKECIDTLNEALSAHKDDLMVIIAGYENELNECFFSYNQGLRSRFPWVFKTDKYSAEDLKEIFKKKVKDIDWSIDTSVDLDFFEKNMKSFPYYGRDMENLLLKSKIAHGRRVFGKSLDLKTKLTKEDLEKGLILYLKHTPTPNPLPTFISHLYN